MLQFTWKAFVSFPKTSQRYEAPAENGPVLHQVTYGAIQTTQYQ